MLNRAIFIVSNGHYFLPKQPHLAIHYGNAPKRTKAIANHLVGPETVLFIAQNSTNYCPKWCPIDVKTALIIVLNGVQLMLKQH
jgi:hypothetical protein